MHWKGEVPVVVIGAGVGGLVAACCLAARGLPVLLLESRPTVGGKLREVWVDGRPQDAGPTVFTLREVFAGLFDEWGASFDQAVPHRPLQVLARHRWPGGAALDLHADVERSAAAIAELAGARAADAYRVFCRRSAAVYHTLESTWLHAPRPDPLSLTWRCLRAGRLGGLLRIAPFASLWHELAGHFDDPRLRQLFGRYATYCGSSPFLAPATLMLVAHVEQRGVWSIDGGMARLADALLAQAVRLGVVVRPGAPAAHIAARGGRADAVRLASGERLAARAVVYAGDEQALAQGLLGGEAGHAVARAPARARSLSAITWSMTAPVEGLVPARHNVCFGADCAAEFAALRAGGLPPSPTVYLCAHAATEPADDAAGEAGMPQPLMCLVNAPAGVQPARGELARYRDELEATLARCGVTVGPARGDTVVDTPADFARLFPGSAGALYGRASHGWLASFRRPAARTGVAGLYLAGGSVHPGPGVPMAALSGRQAARSLLADLDRGPAR